MDPGFVLFFLFVFYLLYIYCYYANKSHRDHEEFETRQRATAQRIQSHPRTITVQPANCNESWRFLHITPVQQQPSTLSREVVLEIPISYHLNRTSREHLEPPPTFDASITQIEHANVPQLAALRQNLDLPPSYEECVQNGSVK